jgi:cyclic-di-GMP phosphodiesterase TipF (flagellum assembly factor)
MTAAAIGCAVVLAGAMAHQSLARARRDHALIEAIAGVRRAQDQIEKAFAASRKDIHELALATEQTVQNVVPQACGDVAAEMRVLETLVRQLSAPMEDLAVAPDEMLFDAASAPTVEDDVEGEQLLTMIRDALADNRVDVYLQPVVSLPQRKSRYYETFTRLRDKDGNLLEPGKYIAAAEGSGLIAAIDNNLLFRCVQLVRKSQRRELNFGFFCNISLYTLMDTSFFPEFIDFMERNAGLAANLIFEFTQADLAIHDRGTERNLAQLNDLGFRFSVDGVTSLDIDVESLIERRISFIKIDANTALETLQDADASLQLHRMKRALDRAGIHLIVKKIEEEEQLIELLDYGIDFGQGYLFGTPRLSRED